MLTKEKYSIHVHNCGFFWIIKDFDTFQIWCRDHYIETLSLSETREWLLGYYIFLSNIKYYSFADSEIFNLYFFLKSVFPGSNPEYQSLNEISLKIGPWLDITLQDQKELRLTLNKHLIWHGDIELQLHDLLKQCEKWIGDLELTLSRV